MEEAPASAALTPIRLERREPARNRLRFYNIAVTRTLFDDWGGRAGMGPDRAARRGAGNVV